jgi:diacylglycerol O-acyltransferase / wax synthase
VPFAPLAGNLGLSFVALSYAGRVTIAVRADADRFPDLDVLAVAMREDWRVLSRPTPGAISRSGARTRA